MESLGAFPEGEWDSFNRMFLPEGIDFVPQYAGQFSNPLENEEGLDFINPSSFFPASDANLSFAGVNESLLYSLNALNSNWHYISQESSAMFIPYPSHETYLFTDSNQMLVKNDSSLSMDICVGNANIDEKITGTFIPLCPDHVVDDNVCADEDIGSDRLGTLSDNQKELSLKRKFDVPELHISKNTNSSENTKKKPRVTNERMKRKSQPKKSEKPSGKGNDEESNGGSDGQSSSSYTSDDDNASQETSEGTIKVSKGSPALNLNGKTRAGRGAATDPQSLYARKRRERINERLRILQNLVPNGTKVDISTMLEEAVHYVKFLQHQIKLLSSDDLWMYAPIAYNGIDIAKFSAFQ